MFRSTYQIARVWGIPIRIHISLIALLAYIALRAGFTGGAAAILPLLVIEVGVFVSIALHELGHSFVALRTGARVREITLMFIGGAAHMERLPKRPRDELLMALAGPMVSLLLGLSCFFGGRALMHAGAGLGLPGLMTLWVGYINFFLAGFNLLPAFPMDGGRVLRAALTPRLGRLHATFIAARLGRLVAILFGLYGFLATPTRWLLVAIAFFIYGAAGREYELVRAQETARRVGNTPDPFSPDSGEDDVIIGPPPYQR